MEEENAFAGAACGDAPGPSPPRRPSRRSTSLFGAEVYPRMENYTREEEGGKGGGVKSKY